MTWLDAWAAARRSLQARRSSSSLTFVSVFWHQANEPAPNTYRGSCSERWRCSVSQKHIGSLTRPIKFERALQSRWLRARARGRARRRSVLRRPAHVRRGGGSPIKANGCRASSMGPPDASRCWPRSTDLRISVAPRDAGSALGSVWSPAPVGRLDHPPPLLYLLCAKKRCMSKTCCLLSMK